MDLRKLLKIILGVIATIVLGAIGSGLWERFLGPALDWLTRISIGAFSRGHTWYRDSIYADAAKGFHEAQSVALYTVALTLLPLAYVWLLRRHPTERANEIAPSSVRDFVRSRKGYWLIYGVTMVIIVTTVFNTLRLRHINETITYSLATFEIVRPYVGERQYSLYRSRFYAMRTATEFDSLHREVMEVAKRHGVNLPEYRPL